MNSNDEQPTPPITPTPVLPPTGAVEKEEGEREVSGKTDASSDTVKAQTQIAPTDNPLSEPATGFGVGKDFTYFIDSEVGMTMDVTRIEQLPDGSWKASAKIGSIFGAEVEGELTGTGSTEAEARQALLKERHELNESLWM